MGAGTCHAFVFHVDRRTEPLRTDRLRIAQEKILRRLVKVCSHMPEEELEQLAESMAAIEIKYALRREKFEMR